jgi:hypothetical protein
MHIALANLVSVQVDEQNQKAKAGSVALMAVGALAVMGPAPRAGAPLARPIAGGVGAVQYGGGGRRGRRHLRLRPGGRSARVLKSHGHNGGWIRWPDRVTNSRTDFPAQRCQDYAQGTGEATQFIVSAWIGTFTASYGAVGFMGDDPAKKEGSLAVVSGATANVFLDFFPNKELTGKRVYKALNQCDSEVRDTRCVNWILSQVGKDMNWLRQQLKISDFVVRKQNDVALRAFPPIWHTEMLRVGERAKYNVPTNNCNYFSADALSAWLGYQWETRGVGAQGLLLANASQLFHALDSASKGSKNGWPRRYIRQDEHVYPSMSIVY